MSQNGPMPPDRIGRIQELAYNLWWSWHAPAADLFRTLDYQAWRLSGRNPVRELAETSAEKLQASAGDPNFVSCYDSVMSRLDREMNGKGDTWFSRTADPRNTGPVALFSAEFAIHNSLPIYAGGLGILAGDICKEASDLGLPMVAVCLMYPQGYFHQRVSADGWQREIYQQLDFAEAPIQPVDSTRLDGPVTIQLDNRAVRIGVWQVQVGRTTIYLLDTNVESNTMRDRQLSARLYIADREMRIEQEAVLGVGGVRVLRALGISPSVWHANEGHTAFMMLERARQEIENGASFEEAAARVRATTIFTTHTPVPAGQDVFPVAMVDKTLHDYWTALGIDRQAFMELGQQKGWTDGIFNMSVLALKMADYRNGVSALHGKVSRRMWHGLWPEVAENEVPITHITNGIHVPTWISPEMMRLYDRYLGPDWLEKHDDPAVWANIEQIPNAELWAARMQLKNKLHSALLERAQERWAGSDSAPEQVLSMGPLLDSEALTIGYVRRFAEYKRPALIFTDLERLKRIVNDRWRPVQIVFAGKSHPADFPAKHLLHQVYTLALDRGFQGRIVFVEDHDMHVAKHLVQGVDVWLNNPRRLQEACGTSGMKAVLNGTLHCSVLDGWWYEAYAGNNGWAIGDAAEAPSSEEEDRGDGLALYELLEKKIVPLYYDRGVGGISHGWVNMVKESIRSTAPVFSTRRMLKEYATRMYLPAMKALATRKARR